MYKTTKNHPYLKEGLKIKFKKEELSTRSIIYLRDEDDLIAYVMTDHIVDHPDWFEEVDERWKPQKGELYYFIGSNLEVMGTGFYSAVDQEYYAIGNCFRLIEEAEEKAKQIREILKK